VTLHSKIVSRVPQTDEAGKHYMKRFETTPGRMLLGETLPKSHKVPFETVNRLLTKKEIGDVIDVVYRHTGQKETVLFADAIMGPRLPPRFKAGISFGKDDMIIPRRRSAWSRTLATPSRITSSSIRTASSPSRRSTTR
jgi:DNA-directed RNA polymerase subunit beta'